MKKRLFLTILVVAITFAASIQRDASDVPSAFAEGTGGPVGNDDFANAVVVLEAELPFDDHRNTKDATWEPGDPPLCGAGRDRPTVWYELTPTTDMAVAAEASSTDYDPIVAAYIGDSLAELTRIQCAVTVEEDENSRLALQLVRGQTYYFRVGSFRGGSGAMLFTLRALAPPANDDLVDAVDVVLPFSTIIDTGGATIALDEPTAFCPGGAATVWYAYTAEDDGIVVADTVGSDFTTSLSAWSTADSGLTEVACSNTFSLPDSRIAFKVSARTTYLLQAGGMSFREQSGALVLSVDVGSRPANDDMRNAIQIEQLPYADSVDTLTATREPDELRPYCASGGMDASVWYSYTPEEDTILVADTAGSEAHPAVAIYEADSTIGPKQATCVIPSPRSLVGFQASAGTTYLFQVGTPTAEGFLSGAGTAGANIGPAAGPDLGAGTTPAGRVEFSLTSIPIPDCPPPQFSVPDPKGDFLYSFLSEAADVVSVSGGMDAEYFCVTIEFAGPVSQPGTWEDDSTFVRLSLDLDSDPSTGIPGSDFYCDAPARLGVDFSIGFSGGAGIFVPGEIDAVALFDTSSLTLAIPSEAFPDGPVRFTVMVGPSHGPSTMPIIVSPSDCAPDSRIIQWPTEIGDVRCDGTIDSVDAALVLQYDAGLVEALPCQASADVNGDEVLNSQDAALILQYQAGLLTSLAV